MRRLLGWSVSAIGGAGALLLLMHVFISPVHPKQEAPEPHVRSACWACHTVSSSVEIVEP